MADLEVHSFHINAGNGDAAIHLQVQPGTAPANSKEVPKGIVKRALLVDGGKLEALENIRSTIRYIETTYDITAQDNVPQGATRLAFDGFTISRWAVDHSAGLLNLIVQQLIKDYPVTGGGAKVTQQARCSLMKYSGNRPASYIYSPYWNGIGASVLIKNGELAPTQAITLDKDGPFAFDDDARLINIQQNSNTWNQVCYLLAGPRELIGREFFTGKSSAPSGGSAPRWYGDVVSMAHAAGAGDTGVFCIGADGVVMPSTQPSGTFTPINLDSLQSGIPSIILVAVVKDQVQHYFSGDSDYQADEAAALWIKQKVPVVKLSSHGSLVSWPHKFVDTFRPDHFICSAGQSTDSIHPRWELLLLLNALVQSWKSTGDELQRWFHPTNYPMYFVQKDVNPTSPPTAPTPTFNFDAFSKGSSNSNILGFQSMLQQADRNLLALFRETLSDSTVSEVDRTRFVIDYLRNLWPSMSYSTSEQHPVPGATVQGIVIGPQTQLLFVLAKLVTSSVTISYVNGAWKTLVNSESPPAFSTDLDPGKGATWASNGYKGPKDLTSRGESMAGGSTTKIDTAPQGVKLPPKVKSINEMAWSDQDDETPNENYVNLIHNIYDPTPLSGDDTISIFGSATPAVWLVANSAYPNITSTETDIRILQAADSMSAFIDGLATGFIGLPNSADSVTLDQTKDLWGFCMGASMISTSISFTMDPSVAIKAISMKCNLFSSHPLTFETGQNALQFGNYWPSNSTSCTIEGTNVVLVGLKADSDAMNLKVLLSDVLKAFQAYPPAKSTGSKLRTLLDVIDEGVSMKLEPTSSNGDALRNAIWCTSGELYSFTLRLTWSVDPSKLDDVLQKVVNFLSTYLQINASNVQTVVDNTLKAFRLETQITGTYHPTITGGYHIVTESRLKFSTGITIGGVSLGISITVANNGDFAILIKGSSNISSYLGCAQKLCSTNDSDTSISNANVNLQSTDLSTDLDTTKLQLANIWISRSDHLTTYGLSFVLEFHGCPICLTYSSAGIYSGALMIGNPPQTSEKLLPSYDIDKDAWALVKPSSSGLPISSLWGGIGTDLPNGMPNLITQAEIEYNSQDPNNRVLSLSAVITRDTPQPIPSGVPALEIDKFTVNAVKQFGSSGTSTLSLATDITINGAPNSGLAPATLSATLEYNKSWSFQGHLESFQLGLLYSHFPAEYRDAASALIGKINVKFVDIVYTYNAGAASSFLISGVIDFGGLELRLLYQYTTPGDQSQSAATLGVKPEDTKALGSNAVISKDEADNTLWKFQAYLGSASNQQSTIGSILESIDAGLSNYLPAFVNTTVVQPASGTDAPVKISVLGTDTDLFFVAHVHLGDASLTFVQISAKAGGSLPKRILRISVSTLPVVKQIPLVNQLPPPFDDLEYMWVSYPAPGAGEGKPEDSSLGFSAAEIADINAKLKDESIPLIPIKESTRADPNSTGQPPSPVSGDPIVALAAGQHFVVIHGGNVILDYVFGSENPKATPSNQKAVKALTKKPVIRDLTPSDPAPTDQPVKKGALNSHPSQFLTISNIGLSYSDGILWLDMDATVLLGPISFALLGFGLGFDISSLAGKGGLRFSSQVVEDLLKSVRLTLHGAEVSFSQPPLEIGGVFIHNNSNGIDSYAGGLTISIPPYTLIAVGEYDKVTGPPEYKSVFIFAKLDGPLFSIGFATVEGVRAGFGYDSFVQTPDLDQLSSFPFINDSNLGSNPNDPLAVLQAMEKYVTPQDGTFWGAIGMKVNALDLISATAVAIVEYSPKGLDISIYVDATLQMPPRPPGESEELVILYVEITMKIELNFIEGYFGVEASLAPSSYLLVPQCHLTGGFALYYWFEPNPASGDWVFTLGGYHPQFIPPPYYPKAKRIGISFQLGGNINVTGETYFAMCPKAVMGGGRLHLDVSIPLISAYLDAYADFLIMYKPLHYIADIGVDVGVSFDADIWITQIHISTNIGANLHIEGPSFGGIAHVNFWMLVFDIEFGSQPSPPLPLILDGDGGFYEIVEKPGPDTKTTQDESDSDPTMNRLKITLEAGSFPDPNNKNNSTVTVSGTPWRVRGGDFVFRVTCVFAISKFSVNNFTNNDVKIAKKLGDPVASDDIYANPMHLTTPISSVLNVTVTPEDTVAGLAPVLDLYKPLPIIKAVPKALWRKYDINNDPQAGNQGDLLDGTNSTVRLAMGVSITAPDPQISYDMVPAFHAADAMSQNVYPEVNSVVTNPFLNDSAPVQTSWLPAPVAGATAQDQWDSLQKTWIQAPGQVTPPTPSPAPSTPPVSELQNILSSCASVLGWAAALPPLKGDLPKKLLGNGFDSFYLSLPQVAGAA